MIAMRCRIQAANRLSGGEEGRPWVERGLGFGPLFSISLGNEGLFVVFPVDLPRLYKFGVAFFISVICVPHYLRDRFELIIDER